MRRAAIAATLLALVSCTKARLFGDRRLNPPDQAEFVGEVCTSDPAEQAFPVRVLFLADTSVSDATYINQRGDSIERIVRSFPGANYSYSIIRYSGPLRGTVCGFRDLTPDGFTDRLEEAVAGVRCADAANPGRDIIGALSLANSVISGDVLATPLGPRSRTKYVVVLLANGGPSASLSRAWCGGQSPRIPDDECDQRYASAFCDDVQPAPQDCERYQYVRLVRTMRDFVLDNGAQEFFFHAVYQRDPDDAMANQDAAGAVPLFADLALQGGGALYRFDRGGRCDVMTGDTSGCLFSNIDLESTQSVFQRKQLIVTNRSALATGRGILPDTDQDGLDDATELELGTDPVLFDTDGDSLTDRLEHVLRTGGLDPLRDDLSATGTIASPTWPVECPLPGSGNPRAFPPRQDRDGDGLTDCAEILLRSDPSLFDSDGDGIPDRLEFRYGTNPIARDILDDDDADGFANLDEYRFHLAPMARDPSTDGVYRYEISDEVEKDVVSFKQPFELTGVFIVRASDASSEGRATIYYERPPDLLSELSETNFATLSWRDPLDTTPNGASPGRGPLVRVTQDGVYTLYSANADPLAPALDRSVTVEVITDQLPAQSLRNDVRLRRSRRVCFSFNVSGVQLVDTLPQPDTGQAGVNFIDVFLAEAPKNNPGGFGVYRAASVAVILDPVREARRSLPPIELYDEDFLLFGE